MGQRMDNLPWEFDFEEEIQWESDIFLDTLIDHLQHAMKARCLEYSERAKENEDILLKAFGDETQYYNFKQLQNEVDFILLKTVFMLGAKTGLKLLK